MNDLTLIKEMTLAHGPSGFEGDIKNLIVNRLKGRVEFGQDNLGSLICTKAGSSRIPKIMIPGHMDEVGFMVTNITKDGYIKFIPLGGWWDQVLLAQKIIIKTKNGDIPGIIGSTPPHLMDEKDRQKIVKKQEMFIDVGATDKEDAEKNMNIRPGDPIVPDCTFQVLHNNEIIMTKALDNRLGCCLFIEVIEALTALDHPNTVYGVGTVQEEVGLRGATTAANFIRPDICLTIDVAIATDVPGLEKEPSNVKLGKGPVLTLADSSMIADRSLRDLVMSTAEKNNIPLQFNTMMGGGTDGGAVHKSGIGVPTIALGIPTRYIHSHYGLFHFTDYKNTLKLLLKLVMELNEETVKLIKDKALSL